MRQNNTQQQHATNYTVRVVTAKRGGEFVVTSEFGAGDKLSAIRKAEDMQLYFDRDCDAARAYVIAPNGIPCHAAGTPQYFAQQEQRAARQLPPRRVGAPPQPRRRNGTAS